MGDHCLLLLAHVQHALVDYGDVAEYLLLDNLVSHIEDQVFMFSEFFNVLVVGRQRRELLEYFFD